MNKQELINEVARKSNTTKKQTSKIITSLLEVIEKTVANQEKVTLVGFGTFDTRERSERMGRNPKTGEKLLIPSVRIPIFSAGKDFKEQVKEKAKG